MADQRQVLLASPIEMATTTTTTTTTIKQRHHRLQRRRRPLTTVLAGWTVPLPLISLLLLSCLLVATTTTALHADEAGLNDFSIATAGHGRATYASYLPGTGGGEANDDAGVLVTSNSAQARDNNNIFGGKHNFKSSSSCHVAARDASTGELLWRRDACSGPSPHRHRHSTSASVVVNSRGAPRRTAAYTLDDAGVLRGWHAGGGGDAGPRGPGEGGNDAAPPSDIVAGGAALFDVEVPGAASDSSEEESVAGYGPPRVRSFKGRPGKPPLVAALYPRSSVVIPTRLAGDDDEGGGDQASSRNVREIGGSGGGGEGEEGAFDGLSFHLGDTGNILPIIVDPDDNKKNTSDAVTAEQLLRISGAREPSGDGGGGGGGARIVAMEGQHGMGDRIAVVAAWPSSPDDATSCPCSSVAVFEFQRTYGGMGSIDPHAITMDHASVLECAGGGGKSQRIDLDSVRLVSTGGGGPMVVAALSASGDAALTAPVGRKGDAAGFGPTRVEASEIAGDGAVLESLDVLTDGADGPTALPLLRMGSVGGGGGRPVVLAVGDDGTLGVAGGGGDSSTPAIGGGGETEDPSARRSHLVAACRDPTDRNFVLLVRVDGVRPVGGGTCAGGGDADSDSDSDSDRYRLLLTRWEESTGDETVVARRTIRRPDSDGDSPPLRPSVHGDAVDLFVNCPGPHDRNKKIMAAQGAVPVAVSALLSTSGGSTVALSVHPANGTVDTSWIAEEGLADVRSVAFVDASHHHAAALAAAASAASSDQGEEDDDDDAPPTLGARLRMQLRSLGEASGYVRRVFAGPTDAERRDRDAGFGFAKVAVALADGGGGADVSENARVFGIDASLPGPAGGGGGDGRARWSRLLPAGARRHVLVHGGGVGGVGHGGGGGGGGHGHHDHEVLVLSEMGGGRLEYECLDGVGGTVLDRGTSSLGGGGVVQVVPLRVGVHHHHHAAADGGGHHHSPPPVRCRQHALVLAGDGRVSVVPDSPAARGAVLRSLLGGREDGDDDDGGDHYGGYYMHHVDVAGGTLRSLQVVPSSSSADGDEDDDAFATTVLVGEASFPLKNERIVSVGYPPADEVVQSPAAVLGDDSLLLKYLNPHLAAVVTRGTEDYVRRMEAEVARWGGADASSSSSSSSSSSPFASAFGGTGEAKVVGEGGGAAGASSPGGGRPKRPLGATRPGEGEASASPASAAAAGSSAKSSAVPTLFVNLVDTVSGRVLYRVSHVGAEPYRDDLGGEEGSPSSDDVRRRQGVPVVVSENWVVYAFWNVKTKRTEVGVLTLHEGMIDRHGLTAFSGPHQEATFSGFEAPRPIVLHRTYGLAKTVTALGVTRTARGITPSQFVAALGSDQLLSIDRRLLDPRRPSGEVRDTEKAEGLLRYHPLVPLFPQRLVSYDVPVEGVRGVASAAASVESQSLVLAYGGPDVFFARVAPSKGFDLLPDSFNKGLLSVVVVALVCLVFVLQRMSGAKNLKVSWS